MKAQLITLPPAGRTRARCRVVNLADGLRQPGAATAEIRIEELTTHGFTLPATPELEVGTYAWLKLGGMEAVRSRVAWIEGEEAGCEFLTPLHQDTLEAVLAAATARPAIPTRKFLP